MSRRYEPCEKVLDVFPNWTMCERPAPAGQAVARCERHPVKVLWPGDEPEACPHDWQFYSGALGYESRKCSACGVDEKDLLPAMGEEPEPCAACGSTAELRPDGACTDCRATAATRDALTWPMDGMGAEVAP